MISKKTVLLCLVCVIVFMLIGKYWKLNIKEPFYTVPWQPYLWDSYGNYNLNYRNSYFWYRNRYYPFVNKYVYYEPPSNRFFYYDRYLSHKHYLNFYLVYLWFV